MKSNVVISLNKDFELEISDSTLTDFTMTVATALGKVTADLDDVSTADLYEDLIAAAKNARKHFLANEQEGQTLH